MDLSCGKFSLLCEKVRVLGDIMDNKEKLCVLKKKGLRNIFIIILAFILIFLFKVISFGYDVKHVKYTFYDDKFINLGVPKFSFLMQNNDENYSFKSFRSKGVLEKEVKKYLNTLEDLSCNNTIYYYDEDSDITIIDYSIISNPIYSTISYSLKNGNYCDNFKIKEYGDVLGSLNGVRYIENDDIYISFMPSYIDNMFVSNLKAIRKSDNIVLEDSSGSFEIKNNELIYFRENMYEENINIPKKSIFKIKDNKLILKDNYFSDYIDEIIL